jgi:hypothetical protein
MQYKLLNETPDIIKCTNSYEKVLYIPKDEANTDYQAYLKWLEEGNTPLPADE